MNLFIHLFDRIRCLSFKKEFALLINAEEEDELLDESSASRRNLLVDVEELVLILPFRCRETG